MQHQITTRLARLFAIALTGLTLAGLSGCATHSGTEGTKITAAANEQIVMEEFMTTLDLALESAQKNTGVISS